MGDFTVNAGFVKIFDLSVVTSTVLQRADASVVGYSEEGIVSSVIRLDLLTTSVTSARFQKVETCPDGQKRYLCISTDTIADDGF